MAFPLRGWLVTDASGWPYRKGMSQRQGTESRPPQEKAVSRQPVGVPICSRRWVLNTEFEGFTCRR